MKTWLPLTAALAITACSSPGGGGSDEEKRLAAPTPADIRYRFNEGYDERTVTVPAGESFALEMESWFEWSVAEVPPVLAVGGKLTGPTDNSDNSGASYWQVWVFEAREVGEGVVRLTHSRPWEPEHVMDEFTLNVRVVPAQRD